MRSRKDGAASLKARRRIFFALCLISFGLGGLYRLKDVPEPPFYRDTQGMVWQKQQGGDGDGDVAMQNPECVSGGRTAVLQEVRILGPMGAGR
jgi:hypothetical protein